MKRLSIMLLALTTLLLSGCNEKNRKETAPESTPVATTLSREEIKALSFDQLFKEITPKEIPGDVFTLVSEDFSVITGGTPELYNTMVASWGGWGTLFNKPAAWCFLRSSRYTLELIRKDLTYTVSFFDDEYKGDILAFGAKSGRDSEKMKETKLTAVQTPAGSMSYKEAKIIIACKLVEVTTVSPDDFLTEEGRTFVTDAYAETKAYHKIVFGEITNVWVKK
ncbi:hypothetical protein AGMMS49574_18350 [Bacteroidia bacterium]|nr:hypothetical protein AGMMS49574_18350 [Bacteroidia bacterium]